MFKKYPGHKKNVFVNTFCHQKWGGGFLRLRPPLGTVSPLPPSLARLIDFQHRILTYQPVKTSYCALQSC